MTRNLRFTRASLPVEFFYLNPSMDIYLRKEVRTMRTFQIDPGCCGGGCCGG